MDTDWDKELERWLEPFVEALGHRTRRRMCPVYVAGLIGPGDRKSVQPMAARDSAVNSARARGRVGGNPGVRAGDPAAIAKIVKSMDETYVTRLIDGMETFMPTVRKMRPAKPWPDVAAAVTLASGTSWTTKRLRQSVRRLVAEGLVDRALMGRSALPRRRRSDELAVLVQGIAMANPGMSLRAIGGQLEVMKLQTPAGKTNWSPTSVSHLLNKLPPVATPDI